jgi:hypothetical protein
MSRLLDNEGHADAHEPVEREVREQGDPEQGPTTHVFSRDIHTESRQLADAPIHCSHMHAVCGQPSGQAHQ